MTLGAFLISETCLGEKTNTHLKALIKLAERTTKEEFFINLAAVLTELADMLEDIRQNCHLN